MADGLSKGELLLAKLIDWSVELPDWISQDEINREIEEAFKKAREFKAEWVWVKKDSTEERINLKTKHALGQVKRSLESRLQKEEREYEEKKEKMFNLTESTKTFIEMFHTKLNPEQQKLVVQHFFWVKENWWQDIISGSRKPELYEIRDMKLFLFVLCSYYDWINERLEFIRSGNMPFKWDSKTLETKWKEIQSFLTIYWTEFSLKWAEIDNLFEAKKLQLKQTPEWELYPDD